MSYEFVASNAFEAPEFRGSFRQFLSAVVRGAVALALMGFAGVWIIQRLPNDVPVAVRTSAARSAPALTASKPAAVIPYSGLFDPRFFGSARFSTAPRPSAAENRQLVPPTRPAAISAPQKAPPAAAVPAPEQAPPVASVALPAPEIAPAPLSAAIPAPESASLAPKPTAASLSDDAPLPPLRPAEFASPPSSPVVVRRPGRSAASVAAPPQDNRNFFEKLFGIGKPSAPPLAYAAPESNSVGPTRNAAGALAGVARSTEGFGAARGDASGSLARYDRWTAVYDLTAHVVYLPDGTRLEAHSGLGDRLDDPAHVNERGRGATPPHVYALEPREELFHGVQALRLNPIGAGDIFGRAGLLAHTYMLGPNGDSNGCVSFRDYDAFLHAYQSGQVKRLAVVARL